MEQELKSLPTTETTTMETDSPTPTTETVGLSLSVTDRDSSVPAKTSRRTALDRLEDSIGGRENLIDTLALSNLDKKQQHFLRLLCDPAKQRHSLVTLARDSGLTPLQILDMFRTASFAKANALAMGHLSEALPDVVKDLAAKSVDAKVECPRCFGEKYEREGLECQMCLGRGEIFRGSDLDRQKIVLESTGVTKKSPGVAVQVNQTVGVSMPSNMFSKYVKASDDTAYDVGVIDAEVKS